VDVVHAEWTDVPGSWDVRPLPPPVILSRPGDADAADPDPEVFGSDSFWPARPVKLSGTALVDGRPHAELVVRPFRYNPVSRRLQRLRRLRISVATAGASRLPPAEGEGEGWARMLIVTGPALQPIFEELADWRTRAGVYTEVVTTEEAYSWPGCDNPERIRNYVIDYRAQHGLDYLLLAGDTAVVPCRYAFPMTYGTGGGRDDNMPCDLYYSDLDGSWNADGDTVWGEVADSVDLAPDVAVGRASVENMLEASEFVSKTISYEQAAFADHLEHGLFIAQILMPDPYTPGAVLKDYIDETYMPAAWEITKLYESQGTYGPEATVEALDQGVGCLNISAHGWTSAAGCLGNEQVAEVDSDGRFGGLSYATSCWSGAFDFDCVAENYVNHPDGCGVGFIANSSYGWGSPGNPLFGYSDRLDKSVYGALFGDSSLTMGEVLAQSKTEYVPFAGQENCYRCILFMANLFGDPSLSPYRGVPVNPAVSAPGIVTVNTEVLPVSVSVPEGSPEGAVVCVSSPDLSVYETAELDGSGVALLELSSQPGDDLQLTVTGPDLRRSSTAIPFASGPSLAVTAVEVETPEGYWVPAPGCLADVTVTLTNQGSEPLTGIELDASLASGPGQLLSGSASYADLDPGESGQGDGQLELQVNADAGNGQLLELDLAMTSGQGSWSFPLPLLVCAPGLHCCGWTVDDASGGNGNGYPEPGEEFDLQVCVANTGLLAARDASVSVFDQVPWLTWTADSCSVDSVAADSTAVFVFEAALDGDSPEPGFPRLFFDMAAEPACEAEDSLVMTVGDMGFSEDVESGSPGWTHGGEGDLWHITSEAGHSGQSSWYCGLPDTTAYQNDMNCWLRTPEIYLGPEAELTFWSRFDIYLYGADGLYVILHELDQLQRDTLDFIGAGGLLALEGPAGEGNMQWLPRTYDLSEYGYGTCCKVEFAFYTDDEDIGGGFWVDDVSLCGWTPGTSGTSPGSPVPGPPVGLPSPNPACGSLSVPLNLPQGPVSLGLYDLAGRLVWHRRAENGLSGSVSVPLRGLGSGVYMIRVEHRGGGRTMKAVVLGEGS
jgi:hypothetical protein